MPSTIGLGQVRRTMPDGAQIIPDHPERSEAGDVTLPAAMLAQAGLEAGDDLVCETGPDGLRVTSDTLRKVYVEVTNACNLACKTCIRHDWGEPIGHMPVARFRHLLDGLPRHPVALSLGGFGEPLVHPELVAMIRLARGRGLRMEIITNGTLMDAGLAREMATLGVAQVAVSIDGGDEEAYATIRGCARDPAVSAVVALLEARRRARVPMAIGAAFVATRRNVHTLPGLLQMAHDLDLDFVSISNVVPHTAEMAAEMLWGHAAWAAGGPPNARRPRLNLARIDVDDSTRPALAATWERAGVAPPPGLDEGRWRNHCRFVNEGILAVSWDGRAAPCLALLHTHREHINGRWKTLSSYTIGNTDDRPLSAIWRDAPYRAFRRRVRAFDFSPCLACGGCPETDTNESDCYGSPFPACGECLWAQGIVLCP